MNERIFSDEFSRGLGHLAIGEWYKIPDSPPRPPCHKCHTPPRVAGGSSARPYDHYWFVDPASLDARTAAGRLFFGLELKQALTLEWRYSRLQEHQRARLLRVERTGGPGCCGVVVVNFRRQLDAGEKKRLGQTAVRFNAAYAVRISELVKGRKAHGQDLPIEWFQTHGVVLPRLDDVQDADGKRVIAWDPRPLLGLASALYRPTPDMFAWLDAYQVRSAARAARKREEKRRTA